jgi:hypothetical protein
MPTIYRSRGNAIEKIGPHEGGLSGRGTVIAFCVDERTASVLVKAINVLEDIYIKRDLSANGRMFYILTELSML